MAVYANTKRGSPRYSLKQSAVFAPYGRRSFKMDNLQEAVPLIDCLDVQTCFCRTCCAFISTLEQLAGNDDVSLVRRHSLLCLPAGFGECSEHLGQFPTAAISSNGTGSHLAKRVAITQSDARQRKETRLTIRKLSGGRFHDSNKKELGINPHLQLESCHPCLDKASSSNSFLKRL